MHACVQAARAHAPCVLVLDALEAAVGPAALSTQPHAQQAHRIRTGALRP